MHALDLHFQEREFGIIVAGRKPNPEPSRHSSQAGSAADGDMLRGGLRIADQDLMIVADLAQLVGVAGCEKPQMAIEIGLETRRRVSRRRSSALVMSMAVRCLPITLQILSRSAWGWGFVRLARVIVSGA